jgi:hypothetical protein
MCTTKFWEMLDFFLSHNDLISYHLLTYLSYSDCCHVVFLNKSIFSLLHPHHLLENHSSLPSSPPPPPPPPPPRLRQSVLSSLISYSSPSPFIPISLSPPSSHYIWMILVTQKLNISYPLTSYSSLENSLGGWKQIFYVIDALERSLSLMKSPGCQFQKYLRSFVDLGANSPLVRNVIKGVSLLPETLEECFHSLTICDFTPELEGAWYVMNDWFHNKSNLSINYDDDFIPRYLRLFAWVVSDQNHLRVIMAQYNQLACRGFRSSRQHSRCVEALRDLLLMRNGRFEAVRLWA